jgi:hypothetical protein
MAVGHTRSGNVGTCSRTLRAAAAALGEGERGTCHCDDRSDTQINKSAHHGRVS